METLKDWKPGDEITARHLQDMVDAVRELEQAAPTADAPLYGGKITREQDGEQEWPWQVYEVAGAEGRELRAVPGEVLTHQEGVPPELGIQMGIRNVYAGLDDTDPDATLVRGITEWTQRMTVYLVLQGAVSVEPLDPDLVPDFLIDGADYPVTSLSDPQLFLTVNPPKNALRVWPLAVYDPAHEQPLTQLQWGILSAAECRYVCDEEEKPVPPADRSAAVPWGNAGHSDGMATVKQIQFSTAQEDFSGALHAALDLDGALEFYLGEKVLDDDDPDNPEPGPGPTPVIDPFDPDDPDPDPDAPPPPPGPSPSPTPRPPGVTRVLYGYVAGEGFLSCELMTVNGTLMWVLELDPDFLASVCKNLACTGTLTITASGSVPGAVATVDMGLSNPTATVSGVSVSGNTGLVFHGTNNQDTSLKHKTIKLAYTASPLWQQSRTWYLSPKTLYEAGRYVLRDKGTTYSDPFVKAKHWYRFRVDKALFRQHAQKYFAQRLAAATLSATDSSTSNGCTVTGVLSGSLKSPVFALTLS